MTPATLFNDDVLIAPASAQVIIPMSKDGVIVFFAITNTDAAAITVVLSRLSDSESEDVDDAKEVLRVEVPGLKCVDKKLLVPIKGGDQLFLKSLSGTDGLCTAYLSGYFSN